MDKNSELISLEKELCSFYDFCKENKFTPEEMEQILSPLHKIIRKTRLYKYLKYFIVILLTMVALYYLLKVELVSWHLSAIGRIMMIRVLPYWNWEKYFGEKCLIYGAQKVFYSSNYDCTVCESIDSLSIEEKLDPELLNELYLDINVPLIISDGLRNWDVLNDNITERILKNYVLSKSYPCEISSNIFTNPKPISSILKHSMKFKKWFFHFQNCDYDAVKAFRVIAPRPYFLKPEISPIQYNWVLMSKNYNSPNYKLINLKDKITIVGQIKGSNYVRLTPRKNCYENCPIIETRLQENEALVFGPLWDFEYKPHENGTNVAVILETN